ncbi:DUF882 domain-containing protein [Roseomonas sp. AR75]|jgi:uncharacterized protein YcbK (DUF882 family)|uniref:YcbK family protein n=1 Tax=Roseomonas sp. AR75 TaxID=2562311 RepID=UPI0010C09F80|nr:DUF882 domain-containing protein [Roseomonas sp. AR75]
MANTPRRLLLAASLGALTLPALPAAAMQRPGDRTRAIWIRNQAGEEVRAAYIRADGQMDWQVVARLQRLFRDLRQNATGPMPVLLLDKLGQIQARWGFHRPLLLLSGYRTSRTNASLEGAAQNSRHLEGQAADIQMAGVTPTDLAAVATDVSRHNMFMGIGTYGGFVHVDIGPLRGWRGAAPARS